MRRITIFIGAGVLLLLLLLLGGCTVGPNYTRPRANMPSDFRGADNTPVSSAEKESLGDEKWAAVFKEPELQELIRTALEQNYDIRIAAQRILEQEAQVRITRAQQFPTLSVGGTGAGAELPASSLGSSISSPLSFGSINLSAAWTPDFWGLYRRQTEAARDQLLAQTWGQRAVRMTLVQQVVTTYLRLRAFDQQLALARHTVESRTQSAALTRTLEASGSVPLSDLRQSEQLLYAATAEIPTLEQQIQQTENEMQLLLGQRPGTLTHTDPAALQPVPEDLPAGLPSALLERRPDIRQAESQLMAANAQIGVARAQFFPQVSLSASAGLGGETFGSLVDLGSRTIYGIGSLTQPIFAGGKLRGQYQLSERQKEEMLLNYQKTIDTALHDVSNALIAVKKEREARMEQEHMVAAAQDSLRLARLRYEGGAASYLEVLTTDTNLFSAQLNLVAAQRDEALTLVQLYSSLGGGWN
ncbi:MAG TPA: efflux transporter outer membrane subunit [Bryobacteraceae bacterium]|nr:efflux transporter outer membrane subunit [Bryobacteraceae bacterium]